jgi:hypothetical protein
VGRHDADAYRRTNRIRIALQALQVRTRITRAVIAQVAIFLQRLVDDPFQFGR